MNKIYSVSVQTTAYGIVSIEAESEAEAISKLERLNGADALVVNIEPGDGFSKLVGTIYEEKDADDGNHMMQTPRANAQENEDALDELDGEAE